MEPSRKQIDFATEIAETCGDDLPGEFTAASYGEFISDHLKEFQKIRSEIRYASGKTFTLSHSYNLGEGFNGDAALAFNPWTRGGDGDG